MFLIPTRGQPPVAKFIKLNSFSTKTFIFTRRSITRILKTWWKSMIWSISHILSVNHIFVSYWNISSIIILYIMTVKHLRTKKQWISLKELHQIIKKNKQVNYNCNQTTLMILITNYSNGSFFVSLGKKEKVFERLTSILVLSSSVWTNILFNLSKLYL